MAKGNTAKTNLINRFIEAAGSDYAGASEDNKKFYFWSNEDGEKLQVCVTMTVPKTPVQFDNMPASNNGFDEGTSKSQSVDMTQDEKATLDRLMKELGL